MNEWSKSPIDKQMFACYNADTLENTNERSRSKGNKDSQEGKAMDYVFGLFDHLVDIFCEDSPIRSCSGKIDAVVPHQNYVEMTCGNAVIVIDKNASVCIDENGDLEVISNERKMVVCVFDDYKEVE